MTDKTDNPEMIKVYLRLSTLLRQLESMMEDVEELKQDIDFTWTDISA